MSFLDIFPLSRLETVNGIPIPKSEERGSNFDFSFSKKVSREIKERDNYTCSCGRHMSGGLHGGYKIDASHIDHNKNNPYYNNQSNGLSECLLCHTKRHIDLLKIYDKDDDWAYSSLHLICERIWRDGLHTSEYQEFIGCTLEEDRMELTALLESENLCISDFVKLDEENINT